MIPDVTSLPPFHIIAPRPVKTRIIAATINRELCMMRFLAAINAFSTSILNAFISSGSRVKLCTTLMF